MLAIASLDKRHQRLPNLLRLALSQFDDVADDDFHILVLAQRLFELGKNQFRRGGVFLAQQFRQP